MTEETELSRSEVVSTMQAGWRAFTAYLESLSEAQATWLMDSGGWTIKDHVIHLAVWEDSMYAMFAGRSRAEAMGVDYADFAAGDWDKMNAVIQRRCKRMTWKEVMTTFRQVHERLMNRIESLSDEDLQRPYCYYQPDTTWERPAIATLIGNTSAHYAEHLPWIEAIAAGGADDTGE